MPKVAIFVLLILACAQSPSIAANANQDSLRSIYVPPGDLIAGLKIFAKLLDVELVYRPDELAELRTYGVQGKLSSAEALKKLLEGTALTFHVDRSGVLLISAVNSGVESNEKLTAGMATLNRKHFDPNPPVDGIASAESLKTVSTELSEVIVSARRRDERLQDVPVAVTVFTTADLTRYRTNSIEQIAAQTPQLLIEGAGGPGGPSLSIRGVESPNSGTTIDQAVSVNIDGVQFSQSLILRMGLYDIDRVEVLKGPQALFFGKNSPGGIISIVSANPGDKAEANLRGGYEFANQRKFVESIISAPLTEMLSGRIDAYFEDQRGWFRNDAKPIPAIVVPSGLAGAGETAGPGVGSTSSTYPNQRTAFIRGTLAFKSAADIVNARLKMAYLDQDQKNGLAASNQFVSCAGGAPQLGIRLGSVGSRDCTFDRNYNESDISPRYAAFGPTFAAGHQYYRSKQLLTSLTNDYRVSDWLKLTSITGYYTLADKFTGNYSNIDLDFVQTYNSNDIDQFSEELRLASSYNSPFNFVLGGYFQNICNQSHNQSAFDAPLAGIFTGGVLVGPTLVLNNAETQWTNAKSVFFQFIVDATMRIQLTAGGRYSVESKHVKGAVFPDSFTTTTMDVPITPDHKRYTNFSPEVTVTYKPLSALSVYGSYRQGFQSGGFNLSQGTIGLFGSTSAGDLTYNQETVNGGEIGVKGTVANRQVYFDFVGYRYKYAGLQASAFDPISLGYQITNATSSTVKGVELAFQYHPIKVSGLTLRGSLDYNDARYGPFENASCHTGQTPADGCSFIAVANGATGLAIRPINPNERGNVQFLSGTSLPNAPTWSGRIGGTYEYRASNGLTFSASADENYTGAYLLQEDFLHQPKSWVLFANLAVRGRDGRWEVALIGANLTQEFRATVFSVTGTGGGTGTAAGFKSDLVAQPTIGERTVTLQVAMKY